MGPDSQDARWPYLWAKTSRNKGDPDRYHTLLHHMLDVAAVAGLIWDHWFFQRLRARLERSLGADARTQVVFLSGAHDIGKANPGFQKRRLEISKKAGLRFSENDKDSPHGSISAFVLRETPGDPACSHCSVPAILAQIAGGHHGVFPRSVQLEMGRDILGNSAWKAARDDLLKQLANVVDFEPDKSNQLGNDVEDPAIVPILAGFISVADWIGSNQDFFPCASACQTPIDIRTGDYWRNAQDQAKKALDVLGWLPPVVFAPEKSFWEVFPQFTPNGLQEAIIKLASRPTSPYLMIVEAPMGRGKTEAALYAADMAMCRGFARGMYVAMPTQATGNAMFQRVLDDYLRLRGHQGKLNLQLVHGDALLARLEKEGGIQEFKPNSIGAGGDLEAQSWFTARKRPLLAPFGVGTIDQSLLGVIQTKHWFVRLFGLAGKVVIFDEVHAYDAYMSEILERVLRWLAELDCTVILLSATLPDSKRKALAKAYSGQGHTEYERYPRITLVQPRQTDWKAVCVEVPLGESRRVDISFATTDLPPLASTLSRRLEHGGCAAVICNTVGRSIEVFKCLKDKLEDTECSLFHARTLRKWRREREEQVLGKFGKGQKMHGNSTPNIQRPQRAVLVATQVVEQSLDLDFDFMVSEIAPIDLLLQRCGRLHRHSRERPAGLEDPEFLVLCDGGRTGQPPPSFGKDIERVYERYVLLRTWLVLRERGTIRVPSEIEELVEVVYGERSIVPDDEWRAAMEESRAQMEASRTESRKAACRLLVGPPGNPGDLIESLNCELVDDEDPKNHRTIRAATREGDPSITVVMLAANTPIEFDPDVSEVCTLLDRSVKLSHRGIFQLLRDAESPREWAGNAHLRHARLLRLNNWNQGAVGDYLLTADEELGIVIDKGCGENG